VCDHGDCVRAATTRLKGRVLAPRLVCSDCTDDVIRVMKADVVNRGVAITREDLPQPPATSQTSNAANTQPNLEGQHG
jgi:hypothetical protein